MNVFTYLRVSSKGQVEGDGPARQRETIKAFTSSHNLSFAGEFSEEGISGTVEGIDRPQFAELLRYVANRMDSPDRIGAIVVERMDRLARDLMVQELLLAECRRMNLQVFSVDQGALMDMASNGGDPTRVLIRQILGALAQWEKNALVSKLRGARLRAKAKTGKCEGCKPYGQSKAYPNEKKIFDLMHKYHTTMDMTKNSTQQACADGLNEVGYLTRVGTPWGRASVWRAWKHLTKGKK